MKLFGISKENVTSLREFAAEKTIYPALEQIHGYWDGLCNGSLVPYRSDVDPRALDLALEYTFILERVAPGVCRFRIAGRHLNALLDMDVRGMPITAMFLPEARKEISRIVESVCAEPSVAELGLMSPKSIGRGALNGKILLAPLLDDQGQVTRILGGLQTNGKIGRAPRRFTTTGTGSTTNNPARPNSGVSRSRETAFAESAAEFTAMAVDKPKGKPHPAKAAPRLELVINNS